MALSSALIAVLAAISALLGGHYSNEAMLEQIEASDRYAFFQAKGIKSSVLETRIALLAALGKPMNEADAKKIEDYKSEQAEIKAEADTLVVASQKHLAQQHPRPRGDIVPDCGGPGGHCRAHEAAPALVWSIGLGVLASGFLIQSFLQ